MTWRENSIMDGSDRKARWLEGNGVGPKPDKEPAYPSRLSEGFGFCVSPAIGKTGRWNVPDKLNMIGLASRNHKIDS